jgi:prepilin-type N-terminal cleavage/methylation domain-containing protein
MKFVSSREGQEMKGFTLIELLVVIAIIGILSSVVLASLNSARNKGADTAVRSNLAGARAQAELYYDANNNSYDGVCDNDAGVGGVKTIFASVKAAAQATGITADPAAGAGSLTVAICNDDANGWAAAAPTRTLGAGGTAAIYCVDSTGASATTTGQPTAGGDVNC